MKRQTSLWLLGTALVVAVLSGCAQQDSSGQNTDTALLQTEFNPNFARYFERIASDEM